MNKSQRPVIADYYEHRVTLEKNSTSALQLGAEAASSLLKRHEIESREIDALFTGRSPQGYMALQYNQVLLNELGLQPEISSEVTMHGAGALGSIGLASELIKSGSITNALCVTNEANALWSDPGQANAAWEEEPWFEGSVRPTTPALYGQLAMRAVHEGIVSRDSAAGVAVAAREWGRVHPQAWAYGREPLSKEAVASSRIIAQPFRLLDCAPWYKGGIGTAVFVCSQQEAEQRGVDYVVLRGWGSKSSYERVTQQLNARPRSSKRPADLFRTGAGDATDKALALSGATMDNISLVQTSAPFSHILLLFLIEMGVIDSRDASEWIDSGELGTGGTRAVNTSGGYLGHGQVPQGLYLLTETIDQLKGKAKGRQVDGVNMGLVHGHGGIAACHTSLVLSN